MESYPAAIPSHSSQGRPPARPNSLFGTLKNIVTAPLTWFTANDDFEDVNGKRKPLAQPVSDSNVADDSQDGPPRSKRMRMHSPDRSTRPSTGYLDPPTSAFPSASVVTRSASNQPQVNRHTNSPSRKLGIRTHRTMSLEPSGYRTTQPLRRDDSMRSMSTIPFQELSLYSPTSHPRELSIPPPSGGSHSKLRTSATPQPSRASYGAYGHLDDTNGSAEMEPPSFSSLGAQPVFVRPPSERPQTSLRSAPTLGTLMESQRQSSLFRQDTFGHSSEAGYMSTGSGPSHQPNAAEKALHELDLYKTPLLPTRLRGSATVPEIFRHPKARKTILMQEDDSTTKLGKKKSSKPKVNDKKPYAGQGGMRKLLSRRRQEEEAAASAENSEGATEKKNRKSKRVKSPVADSHISEHPRPPPASEEMPPPRFGEGEQYASSFRVGRSKSSRHHTSSVKMPRTKSSFSASYDEDGDDEDKSMSEETPKKLPVFNIPAGFSFSKPDSPQVLSDSSNAKEPPVSSLPFSLSTPTGTAPVQNSFSVPLFQSSSAFASGPAGTGAAASSAPAPLEMAATPSVAPTPAQQDDTAPRAPTAFGQSEPKPSPAAAVPNFFASSTAFKAPLSVDVPSIGLLAPVTAPSQPPIIQPSPGFGSSAASSFPPKALEPTISVPTPSSALPVPLVEKAKAPESSAAFSGFSFAPPAPPPESSASQPTPPTAVTPAVSAPTKSLFSFDAPKPAEATTTAFSFGSKPAATEQSQVTPSPFSATAPGAAAPASSFTPLFGTNTESNSKKPAEVEVQAASTPSTGSFTFGKPAEKQTNAPATNGLFSSRPASSEGPTPAAAPSFTFGSAAQAQSKPSPFSFGATSAPSTSGAPPSITFGSGISNTPNPMADSKLFSFGATENKGFGQPTTPPKAQDQEVSMDESPIRDVSASQKIEDRPALGSFSFGSAPSSGFGKPAGSHNSTAAPTPSFTFGGDSSGFGSSTSIGTTSQGTGFSFGQQQPQSKSSFSFGGSETPRPSTTGSFGFNSPINNQASPFSFGAPKVDPTNPFAQQSGSVPSSPSTFNAPNPFAFGSNNNAQPAPTPFTFGSSQPSSPAAPNTSLPNSGSGFGGGGGFGASTSNPGNASPSPLFTIGSAPAANTTPGGARAIKKLPARRTGAKR